MADPQDRDALLHEIARQLLADFQEEAVGCADPLHHRSVAHGQEEAAFEWACIKDIMERMRTKGA